MCVNQVGFLVFNSPRIVSQGMVVTYAMTTVAALLGLELGRWIYTRFVTDEGARRCVLVMLVVSATLLGASGSINLVAVSLGVQVTFVFLVAILVFELGWWRLPLPRRTTTDVGDDVDVALAVEEAVGVESVYLSSDARDGVQGETVDACTLRPHGCRMAGAGPRLSLSVAACGTCQTDGSACCDGGDGGQAIHCNRSGVADAVVTSQRSGTKHVERK